MTRTDPDTGKARWGIVAGVAACVLLGGGGARAQAPPCGAGTQPLPPITLTPGEYYFRVDDKPTLLLGTNPYAPTSAEFAPLLAGAGLNEKVVRLHVASLRQNPTYAGEIDQTPSLLRFSPRARWTGTCSISTPEPLTPRPFVSARAARWRS